MYYIYQFFYENELERKSPWWLFHNKYENRPEVFVEQIPEKYYTSFARFWEIQNVQPDTKQKLEKVILNQWFEFVSPTKAIEFLSSSTTLSPNWHIFSYEILDENAVPTSVEVEVKDIVTIKLPQASLTTVYDPQNGFTLRDLLAQMRELNSNLKRDVDSQWNLVITNIDKNHPLTIATLTAPLVALIESVWWEVLWLD